MSVITRDILLEGYRRKDVFEWMSKPANHERMLAGSFDEVKASGTSSWEVMVDARPVARPLGYVFESADSSHRGRRILCRTTGRRTEGKLNYSLRTPRGSNNTLVTLHADYDPGRLVGKLLDTSGLRQALEIHYQAMLDTLGTEVNRDLG